MILHWYIENCVGVCLCVGVWMWVCGGVCVCVCVCVCDNCRVCWDEQVYAWRCDHSMMKWRYVCMRYMNEMILRGRVHNTLFSKKLCIFSKSKAFLGRMNMGLIGNFLRNSNISGWFQRMKGFWNWDQMCTKINCSTHWTTSITSSPIK